MIRKNAQRKKEPFLQKANHLNFGEGAGEYVCHISLHKLCFKTEF